MSDILEIPQKRTQSIDRTIDRCTMLFARKTTLWKHFHCQYNLHQVQEKPYTWKACQNGNVLFVCFRKFLPIRRLYQDLMESRGWVRGGGVTDLPLSC